MLIGMKNKSVDKMKNREKQDKIEGIVGDSGRNTKLMASFFEGKEHERREAKRLRLDTSNRGVNWHQNSIAHYKKGALHISKDNLEKLENGSLAVNKSMSTMNTVKDTVQMRPKEREKRKFSYAEISKKREENPEYMMGKRYQKKRGSMGKLH